MSLFQHLNETLAHLDAVIVQASRPATSHVECVGPGCDRPVFTWLDPACNPGCARRAADQRGQTEPGEESLPVHQEEPHAVGPAADLDRPAIHRWAARDAVLHVYREGRLGYIAPSDEWVDGTGTPLLPSMQLAAAELAGEGLLPEFAEWFPAPSVDQGPRVGTVCTHLAEDETRCACCGQCEVCDGYCGCSSALPSGLIEVSPQCSDAELQRIAQEWIKAHGRPIAVARAKPSQSPPRLPWWRRWPRRG